MHVDLIIPAAGSGRRMGGDQNKLFLAIGTRTVFHYTMKHISQLELSGRLIIVCKPQEQELLNAQIDGINFGELELVWLAGGVERADSVRNGLSYILDQPGAPVVMTHDAARPFVTKKLIETLMGALNSHAAAVPALEVAETTRRLLENGKTEVVDRNHLYLTQTPQAFLMERVRDVFFSSHILNTQKTDEASYFEASGVPVALVKGDPRNIKLTRPDDLRLAEAYLPTFHVDEP